jgi:hypothetical protein
MATIADCCPLCFLNHGVEDLEHDIRESDRIIALREAQALTEQRAG